MSNTVTLYRPVGPRELELIRESGFRRFPPRLPEQPIFYPVVQEEYARTIARDWNAKSDGVGYVTRFIVPVDYLERYKEQRAGGQRHTEYWIPAEDLDEFNQHIVGTIEVIQEILGADWVVAYDLATDHETIRLVQHATLTSKSFGLLPEVALFGSAEWWAAISDGRIRRHEVNGKISRLKMTGHGDWPEFEIDSDGEKSAWSRLGNQLAYVEGRQVRVEYVLQKLRLAPAKYGDQKQVLRILVRDK